MPVSHEHYKAIGERTRIWKVRAVAEVVVGASPTHPQKLCAGAVIDPFSGRVHRVSGHNVGIPARRYVHERDVEAAPGDCVFKLAIRVPAPERVFPHLVISIDYPEVSIRRIDAEVDTRDARPQGDVL